MFKAKTQEVVHATGSAARNTLDSLHVWFWINFQSLWCSKILSCCQVSHDSKTQLWDLSIWGHSPQFEKLGSWQMQAPGWIWSCLIFISGCFLSVLSRRFVRRYRPAIPCCPVLLWMNGPLMHLFFYRYACHDCSFALLCGWFSFPFTKSHSLVTKT